MDKIRFAAGGGLKILIDREEGRDSLISNRISPQMGSGNEKKASTTLDSN